mmetsp:Transcript_19634/g.48929  ORF Transcript_19634/g.48929 Transcript_19634/m.48929 type:complete len:221 (+) Transcript_19634:1112-1774(+)
MLDLLRQFQHEDKHFDFRVKKDDQGRLVAIVWMTSAMRKAWLRYGDTNFLDAMMRKLSALHWPYIGPVVMDSEKRIFPICECLCVLEALEYYAFALLAVFDMEPGRSKKSIRLIFGDLKINKSLLLLLGLPQGEKHWVVWDSFHLMKKVWPEYLGNQIFCLVQENLSAMLYANTRELFDQAVSEIEGKLRSNTRALEYLGNYWKQYTSFGEDNPPSHDEA